MSNEVLNEIIYGRPIVRKLYDDFENEESLVKRWGIIRQVYQDLAPYIKSRANSVNPHFLPWFSFFSHIERAAWSEIRSEGGIVLYPQFPFLNYFIDFANPNLKIGLEMDGKQYHGNSEKDIIRDQELLQHGWKIFHIKAIECEVYQSLSDVEEDYSDYDIYGDEPNSEFDQVLENWFMNTMEGVIYSIKVFYFMDSDSYNYQHYPLAVKSLKSHQLIPFEL